MFAYTEGRPICVDIQEINNLKKVVLPELPKMRQNSLEQLKSKNKPVTQDRPWTLGLVESMAAVEVIRKQKLQTRNRIALILIDSTFEIAMKEYLIHRSPSITKTEKQRLENLLKNRVDTFRELKQYIAIDPVTETNLEHYYGLRCKLIHEVASAEVMDDHVEAYKQTVQKILSSMFGLRF